MKRISLAAAPLFVFLALGARPARAQCSATGNVCITPNGSTNSFLTAAGVSLDQVLSQVDGLFQTNNLGSFLRDFQNAQSFSSKGLGVDYASEATLVEAGATFSVASNVDKAYKPTGSYTDPPISGGGANFSLMAGLGLGLIGLDPVMIFGNWFKGSASLGQLGGNYQNWGMHGQLRLLGPSRSMSATKVLVRWGGIAITSGVDYAHIELSSTPKAISSTVDVAPGAPVTVTSTGNLSFTLDQTTYSVPLEVTTSLRLLSLITVYGGLGLDWQLGGGSNMNIGMNANLTGNYQGTSFNDLGTATINARGHVSPSAARMREIFGVQLSFVDVVRIFAQVNTTASSPVLTSLAVGLRLAI